MVDIVREDTSTTIIDVYECISCSGLPNIGRPVCFFEAGILSSILEKITGKNTVREVKCWALGDTKCRFEIYFE